MAGVLQAGEDFLLLDVRVYWAPRFSKVPPISWPYDTYWPTPWVEIIDTVNGVQVTHRNPTVAVMSEQRDRIGSVRNQGAGTQIQFQALTFTDAFWAMVGARTKKAVAPASEQRQITFNTGVTTNGTLTFVLNGVTYTSAVTTTQSTPTLLATFLTTPANWTPSLPTTGATGWVPTASTGTLTLTATGTGKRGGTYSLSPAATGVTSTAGFVSNTVGHGGYNTSYVDPDKEHHFMVGVEGKATAGSIFDDERIIRGIGYRCENTANAVDVFRRTGADSLLRPNVTLECLPEQITLNTTEMFGGTGINIADLDTYKKFNYFDIPTV